MYNYYILHVSHVIEYIYNVQGFCQSGLSTADTKSKVKVALRLTVSQSVSFGVEPQTGLTATHCCVTSPRCIATRAQGRHCTSIVGRVCVGGVA
jgi:hypothetical protein